MGKIYYIQNEYSYALNELKEAGRLCPQNIHPHLLLAKIYKAMRRFDLALEEIKYGLDSPVCSLEARNELNDMYPEYINEIRSYNFQGDCEKAREKVEEIYSFIPQDDIFSRNKLLSELEIAQKKLILTSKMKNLTMLRALATEKYCVMLPGSVYT